MAHMIQQIIKYSDGTETVIDYRGKIVNGVLIPNEDIAMNEEIDEQVVDAPVEEVAIEPTPEATVEVVEEVVINPNTHSGVDSPRIEV